MGHTDRQVCKDWIEDGARQVMDGSGGATAAVQVREYSSVDYGSGNEM